MNHFIKLVVNMRKLQRQYFLTRDAEVLADSKQAEREVDRELARLLGGVANLPGMEDSDGD